MKNEKMKGFWFYLLVSMVLFPGFSASGRGVESSTKEVFHRVPAVTAQVKIDGFLNDEAWKFALVLELNYEVEPGENIPPPVKTKIFLTYDARHLYVGFRADDPDSSQIRAHVTDRDNILNDDYVGIVLDTFNDSRRAYSFLCNPYGIQADQIITMMGSESQWDGIWNSSGRIDPGGYTVEMAIPFSSLRFQGKKENQVWGIDVVRSYPRNLPHMIGLFPRDRSSNCYMCQAEKVVGFKGVRPGINLELDPTLSALVTREREHFPGGAFIKKTGKVEPGLTARWSFTPNLTLSAALNPDFSQVEADAAQLDINTQFALFYPEKRPFFLEGANIFQSRFLAIHTRTIIDPDWGVKLTGKEGAHSIGFFSARDRVTHLIFPSSQGSRTTFLDIGNISTALRYRWDVGKSSNLGIVITNREGEDYFNRAAGIDGDLRITKKNRIIFQFLSSYTCYPSRVVIDFNQPQGKFSGGAFDFFYSHITQNVNIYGHYQNVTPNFRTDVGFTDQADNILFDGGMGYTWRHNPGYWYTRLTLGSGYLHERDHNKNLLRKALYIWFNYRGPIQSAFDLGVNIGKKAFMGKEFNDNTLFLNTRVIPSGSLILFVSGALGDQVDFTNIQAGKRVRFNPGIQFNWGRRLYLQLDHLFEKLNVEAGRLYTANLSNIRLVYQFNRRTFLRTILQYVNYTYNAQLYVSAIDPVYKHLFTQVLFSYKINPQTVFFLGYSDDYYGFSGIPLKQNNHTFFLKIGYALVL